MLDKSMRYPLKVRLRVESQNAVLDVAADLCQFTICIFIANLSERLRSPAWRSG
jgi:hypothetical protein